MRVFLPSRHEIGSLILLDQKPERLLPVFFRHPFFEVSTFHDMRLHLLKVFRRVHELDGFVHLLLEFFKKCLGI